MWLVTLSDFTRAVAVVLLLIGSLFPSVEQVSMVVVGAALAIAFLAYDLMRDHTLAPATRFALVVLVILASSAVLFPPVGDYGDDKISRLLQLTLLSAAAAGVLRTKGNVRALAFVWLGAALILAATARFSMSHSGRAAGLDENNPVWLGRAIAMGLVVVAWLVWTQRVRLVIMAPVAAVLVGGLLATGSRGPLLAAVLGTLIVVAASPRRHQYQRVLAGIIASFALVLAFIYLPGSGQQQGGLFDPAREISGTSRVRYWTSSLEYIWSHPSGTGAGGWSWATGMPAPYPHNLFLEVFVESGWVFGLGLVAVVVAVIVRLWRSRHIAPSVVLVLAMLTAELVSVSVSGDVNGRTFWFILALGWGVQRMMLEPTHPVGTSQGTRTPSSRRSVRL